MKVDEIKTIVELMAEHNLTEFKIEADDMHICIRRDVGGVAAVPAMTVMPSQLQVAQQTVAQHAAQTAADDAKKKAAEPAAEPAANTGNITAPIVGTFYRAPSPDAQPFAKIGDRVEPSTTVCIIEAMKVMNEIKAEKSGVIKDILVKNAQPVEFGQPLFIIELQ